ncbi:MAG: HAD family phosphatase [Lachnospiraceae bacterium]|nr:HAD family phosphatase [Lachnospiraceae bacterium]
MHFPRLFLFDMDGLLFDTERLFMEILGQTMAEYGYQLTRERYMATVGLSQADVIGVMKGFYGADYPYREISAIAHDRLSAQARTTPLPVKRGLRELLQYLADSGHPCCLASSSPRESIQVYLDTSGLEKYFSFIMSGSDLPHSKPDPEIFLACCRHYGVQPAEALVLEDSENGVRAAVNGGIPVVCIPDMKRPPEELLAQACLTAPDGFAVLDYLKGLPAGD